MIPSVVQQPRQINQLGAELAKLSKQRYSYLSHIDMIATEMRETIGLIAEIISCKLKIVENLLQATERDYEGAQREFHLLLDTVKKEHLDCYNCFLNARDDLMIQGVLTKLTTENKQEMLSSFSDLIEKRFIENQLEIDQTVDLDALRHLLENNLKEKLSIQDQLLESKMTISMEVASLEESIEEIKETQAQLLSQDKSVDIWQASERGDFSFIEKKLNEFWFDWKKEEFVNTRDRETGLTPLCLTTSHGHLNCVKLLLNHKANPTIGDKLGYQPLHWAAKKGYSEIGIELLQSGANVHARGEYGREPLHMAAHNGQLEFLELLLEKGAHINAQTERDDGCVTALHEAVFSQNGLIIRALTKRPQLNVNIVDAKNHTPLYYLVCMGCPDLAVAIVNHSSWKCPQDLENPNHISQLLKIIPDKNKEEMEKVLKAHSK